MSFVFYALMIYLGGSFVSVLLLLTQILHAPYDAELWPLQQQFPLRTWFRRAHRKTSNKLFRASAMPASPVQRDRALHPPFTAADHEGGNSQWAM